MATATLVWSIDQPPFLPFSVGVFSKQQFQFKVDYIEDGICYYISGENDRIVGEEAICDYFIEVSNEKTLSNESIASEVDRWKQFSSELDESNFSSKMGELDSYVALRSFLIGYTISLADMYVWSAIKRSNQTIAPVYVNCSRWFDFISSQGSIKQAIGRITASLRQAAKNPPLAPAPTASAASATTELKGKALEISEDGTPRNMPELPFAEMGKVMTRFPPEASGYMHIGHVKAAMLNSYYSKRYNGKLLLRFDDTNPSKEKEEFEISIIEDLKKLGIVADVFSHTSDFFGQILDFARKLIREGNAFMDNTDQTTMRNERTERKNSKNRDLPVEENLRLFEGLCRGEPEFTEYCLRAKIDMQSDNGTLRDPVLVRFSPLPHLRTGYTYKAYPTYDLACPIVDSIEGVTHAMRTTEYKDRDEQYKWLQKTMGLREVHLVEFARLNFQYTLMSKRKLTWMVENNEVEGWDDPRFPTVKGVLRRGVQVEALRAFILSQGFSKRVVTMEWDKFWSDNKKILERVGCRYMGVMKDNNVPLVLKNVSAESTIEIPLHQKNEALGNVSIVTGPRVLLERVDAESLKDGEEFTLMRWGNAKVCELKRNENGELIEIVGEYVPNGDFKNTQKFHWVADSKQSKTITIVEYDHMLNKKTIDEEDNFEDFLTSRDHPTKVAYEVSVCNACDGLKVDDIIQLERRGFYRCDRAAEAGENAIVILVPDGKIRSMSKVTGVLEHK